MNLWSERVAWASYAQVVVVQAELDEEDTESRLGFTKAKYMIAGTDDKGVGVTKVRAERDVDESVQRLTADLRVKRGVRKLATALLDSIDRQTKLLSRELSRRIGFQPIEGRKNTRP